MKEKEDHFFVMFVRQLSCGKSQTGPLAYQELKGSRRRTIRKIEPFIRSTSSNMPSAKIGVFFGLKSWALVADRGRDRQLPSGVCCRQHDPL
jgi:hypothetical protein